MKELIKEIDALIAQHGEAKVVTLGDLHTIATRVAVGERKSHVFLPGINKDDIMAALQANYNVRTKAAATLGISVRTLYRRMKELNISNNQVDDDK